MDIQYLNHENVLSLLPDRDAESHKGCFGKILLLCGSLGYTGAAALSAMAALRSGAGLVYLGVPQSIYEIEAVKLLEPIVFPLPEEHGMLSANAREEIEHHMIGKDAVLIGPGLGQSAGVSSCVQHVLRKFNGPVVLDADGINNMIPHKSIIQQRTAPTILTPHKAEFERFAFPVGNSCEERIGAAKKLADDLSAIVLLKGHDTVITNGADIYVNLTGNPGMAVAGAGDVLSGLIVSLLGQKLDPLVATACAAWLHGKSGDICEQEIGQYGMLPSDMLNALPRLLK